MKILVVIGHSDQSSLSHALATAYVEGAKLKNDIEILDLATMTFNPILVKGYNVVQPLEPDLERAQREILSADHLVFVFPIWWSLYPAILKGFIDRVFLPGFAFKYVDGKIFPIGLLKGKTAEIIVTSDAPVIYRNLLSDPAIRALKRYTLKFCGIKVKKITKFGAVEKQTKESIKSWLDKVRKRGQMLA